MEWVQFPTTWGWWFFTPKLEDWDLAAPVGVSRIEPAGFLAYFEARFPHGTKRIEPEMGWWFGPVKMERPSNNLAISRPTSRSLSHA